MKPANILISCLFLMVVPFFSQLHAQDFELRRICADGDRNMTFTINLPDTCDALLGVEIFGKKAANEPFEFVDSLAGNGSNEYLISPDDDFFARLNETRFFARIHYLCDSVKFELNSDSIGVDLDAPASITLDSVSVIDSQTVMGWQRSDNPNAMGYRTNISQGQGFPILDTIFGVSNTIYRDTNMVGNPNEGPESYRVTVFDTCKNFSNFSGTHSTIHLTVDQDTCVNEVYLNWTPYEGWGDEGVERYDIYFRRDGRSRWFFLESAEGDTNAFTMTDGNNRSEYCFVVRAVRSGESMTSTSNEVCIFNQFVRIPDVIQVVNATVVGSEVRLNWMTNRDLDLVEFQVFGSFIDDDGFLGAEEQLGTRSYREDNTFYSFFDTAINVDSQVRVYRVEATDNCGNVHRSVNAARNIVLSVNQFFGEDELRWTSYEEFTGGLSGYRLSLSPPFELEDAYEWRSISTEDTATFEYLHNTDNLAQVNIDFGSCYVVKAIENSGGLNGTIDTAYSNVVCLWGNPRVYIPNAFSPESSSEENRTFRVGGILIDESRSSMEIYNRWGEQVYKSGGDTPFEEGWNGQYENSGRELPDGNYLYRVVVRGKNRQIKAFEGTVKLLRQRE